MTEDRRDEGLDRAIDTALREMVGGDGPADMRRRVLARLAGPPRRDVSLTLVLSAAAVIVIAVATVVWRHAWSVPAPPVATARLPPPAAISPSAPAAPPPSPPDVRGRPPLASTRPAPEPVPVADGDIEPIEIAPLAVAPMETPRWAIAPLRIQPMEVAPLADSEPEEP